MFSYREGAVLTAVKHHLRTGRERVDACFDRFKEFFIRVLARRAGVAQGERAIKSEMNEEVRTSLSSSSSRASRVFRIQYPTYNTSMCRSVV